MKVISTLAVLISALLLQGCIAAAVVGTAAVGTKAATDPRTVGTQVDDGTLEVRVNNALSKDAQIKKDARINVTAYQGKVLLTGQTPDLSLATRAKQIAVGVDGATEVYNEIRQGQPISLGTSSSESVLPRMMAKMEHAGVSKPVVGLVIPTGYSFNLDGTAIYLTMAAVFIAQACDVQMTIMQQVTLLAVLLLTSKGAAGVTGSGFIVLAATLSAVGHVPVAGLALILGVDRFMSEARALTNMIGNGIACIVVGHWMKDVNEDQLNEVMHPKNRHLAEAAASAQELEQIAGAKAKYDHKPDAKDDV